MFRRTCWVRFELNYGRGGAWDYGTTTPVIKRSLFSGKPGESWSGAVSEFFKRFSIEMFFKLTDSLVMIGSNLLPAGLPVGFVGGNLLALVGVAIPEPVLRLTLLTRLEVILVVGALLSELRRLPELTIDDLVGSS